MRLVKAFFVFENISIWSFTKNFIQLQVDSNHSKASGFKQNTKFCIESFYFINKISYLSFSKEVYVQKSIPAHTLNSICWCKQKELAALHCTC